MFDDQKFYTEQLFSEASAQNIVETYSGLISPGNILFITEYGFTIGRGKFSGDIGFSKVNLNVNVNPLTPLLVLKKEMTAVRSSEGGWFANLIIQVLLMEKIFEIYFPFWAGTEFVNAIRIWKSEEK